MMRAFLLALGALAGAATAQTPAPATPDIYAPGRAIVADIGRIVTPNGVRESYEVTLGGARQIVSVRGADRDNPILLFVHGGPGSTEMHIAWSFQRAWEDYFTVVQWDQRGAGKSFPLNDPQALAPTMTPDRYRDDAIELIDHLRRRYGQRKIFLLGHSWGSVVGLSVAARRPDLLHAYIGMGQLINARANEEQGFAWTLARAKADGNAVAVRELEALRPFPGAFEIAKVEVQRKWSIHYGALAAGRRDADFYFHAGRISPEHSTADRKAIDDGSAFSVATLWPRLATVDFTPLRRVDVPVILFLGRHDYTTPAPIAATWFDRLTAPDKRLVWFENSAHLPMIEEPGRAFAALLDAWRLAQKP